MSWLWSTSPIDELVDKATSENLPVGAEDLALNLEICDQIRSKQVSPKDAIKALKRRLNHKNPNVQLLALELTDVCVKNGGQHFLVEVASHEFMDNLTSILKAPSACNLDVKAKILGLIQTWGLLFRGKQGLGYVCDTYMILQHEGFQFPPKDNVGAALVESESPPDWTDSDVCIRCRIAFTTFNRKHHCRACGSTFCGQCSSKTMALPNFGVTQEVRVCDGCFMKKKLGNKSVVALESHGLGGGLDLISKPSPVTTHSNTNKNPSTTTASTSNNNNSRSAEEDDVDLLKAIELSLKEANNQPGYSAPKKAYTEPVKKAPVPTSEEEEDADLLAAIEASLRETSIHSPSSTSAHRSNQRQSSYSSYNYTKKSAVTTAPLHELSDTEKSNIEMFSVLVDRIQMMQGDVSGNREIQALYEQISKLQTKVVLSLEEAARKQQEFVTFNEKIDHAVRIYDHLLQERLNSSYQRRMNMNNAGHSGGGYYSTGLTTPQTPQVSHAYPQITAESRYAQYVPGISGVHSSNALAPHTPQISYQTPFQQQQQLPSQSQPQPQQQTPYQYQQPSTSVPYSVTPSGVLDQQPVQQQQYGLTGQTSTLQNYQTVPQQQQQQQLPQPQQQSYLPQQQLNGTIPSVSSPALVNGQQPILNTYQSVGQQSIQSPPAQPVQPISGPTVQQQQESIAPYIPQQQQQQPQQQQQQQHQGAIPQQISGGYQQYVPQPQPQSQQLNQHQPVYASATPSQPKVEEAPLIEL
ncbi:Vacuolar protein-sorting-associated protein 27 [Lobosporangium transversale]|uniref:Vacuolar protein sorting-associated protein 27 n=1 Tax=Lobosporangium transversale TaxID=64571 RepID=A0A1Y2GTI8_9FUNG|nr:hypothetical protein BCR41DRAFT_394384 [Lobosporangium transversale]KAF9899326.1 Vacuolar protein-sorting-associated protein 27 [Lobosporangium transversale]ORZ22811.1 hypothetical protein BCR41DRAFT_394384 [Lobosporangium transversale]|eukprot:XP_021883365.1 hypothetical protein BCR41DRAFT_394384 [Lobosporangium transversale]